jgi:hypothetical protein
MELQTSKVGQDREPSTTFFVIDDELFDLIIKNFGVGGLQQHQEVVDRQLSEEHVPQRVVLVQHAVRIDQLHRNDRLVHGLENCYFLRYFHSLHASLVDVAEVVRYTIVIEKLDSAAVTFENFLWLQGDKQHPIGPSVQRIRCALQIVFAVHTRRCCNCGGIQFFRYASSLLVITTVS